MAIEKGITYNLATLIPNLWFCEPLTYFKSLHYWPMYKQKTDHHECREYCMRRGQMTI